MHQKNLAKYPQSRREMWDVEELTFALVEVIRDLYCNPFFIKCLCLSIMIKVYKIKDKESSNDI